MSNQKKTHEGIRQNEQVVKNHKSMIQIYKKLDALFSSRINCIFTGSLCFA